MEYGETFHPRTIFTRLQFVVMKYLAISTPTHILLYQSNIYMYKLIHIIENSPDVIIKSLLEGATFNLHLNYYLILPLLAVHVSVSKSPPMLIFSKMSLGTLKSFLLRHQPDLPVRIPMHVIAPT